jgi:predicted O-methyltransferase YrrM
MIEKLKPWILFYLKAKTVYQIHSPFIFDIYTNILKTDKDYYAFSPLEAQRKKLIGSSDFVVVDDHGSGSKIMGKKRSISQIAKYGISDHRQCRVLFNIINHFQPTTVLELGTSVGLSACYMASASNKCSIHTVEAEQSLINIAKGLSEGLKLKNIIFHHNIFERFISESLPTLGKIDFLYLDGHHDGKATLNYIAKIKPYLADQSIIMVDDIHWSPDMYHAWCKILTDIEFKVKIESQKFGLLFKGDYPTHEIAIIDYWKKPLQIGLFAK